MAVEVSILSKSYPSIGKPGDVIPIKLKLKQNSDWIYDNLTPDTFLIKIYKNNVFDHEESVFLPNMVEVETTVSITMPPNTTTIKLEIHHQRLVFNTLLEQTSFTISVGAKTVENKEDIETEENLLDKIMAGGTYTVIVVIVVVLILIFIFYSRKR